MDAASQRHRGVHSAKGVPSRSQKKDEKLDQILFVLKVVFFRSMFDEKVIFIFLALLLSIIIPCSIICEKIQEKFDSYIQEVESKVILVLFEPLRERTSVLID